MKGMHGYGDKKRGKGKRSVAVRGPGHGPAEGATMGPNVKYSAGEKGRAYPAGCDQAYTKRGNP